VDDRVEGAVDERLADGRADSRNADLSGAQGLADLGDLRVAKVEHVGPPGAAQFQVADPLGPQHGDLLVEVG